MKVRSSRIRGELLSVLLIIQELEVVAPEAKARFYIASDSRNQSNQLKLEGLGGVVTLGSVGISRVVQVNFGKVGVATFFQTPTLSLLVFKTTSKEATLDTLFCDNITLFVGFKTTGSKLFWTLSFVITLLYCCSQFPRLGPKKLFQTLLFISILDAVSKTQSKKPFLAFL